MAARRASRHLQWGMLVSRVPLRSGGSGQTACADSNTDSVSTDSGQRSHQQNEDDSEGAELWPPPLSEHASPIAVEAEDVDFFSSAPLASASLVGGGSPRPGMRCAVMMNNLETCTGQGMAPLAASAGHMAQRQSAPQSATSASVWPQFQPDGACHGFTSIGHQRPCSPSERGRQLASLDAPEPQKAQGIK